MDTLEDLANLSTREMQVYGAFCLHQFCKVKRISHPFINDLVEHLLSILVIEQLDRWESKGAELELSGRGDPIPQVLITQLADGIREDFKRLVYFAVEIGFVNMYAKSSERPLHNLYRCLAILDANGVERPCVSDLFKSRTPRRESIPDWGETYPPEEFEQVRQAFQ